MSRRTLRHRFLRQNMLLVCGILLFGCVTVWRLLEIKARVTISQSVYAEIRSLQGIAGDVGIVDGLFSDRRANRTQIIEHLGYCIGGLDQFVAVSRGYGGNANLALADAYAPIDAAADGARRRLQGVLDQMGTSNDGSTEVKTQRAAIEAAQRDIAAIASSCVQIVSSRQQAGAGELAGSLVMVSLLLAVAVVAATVVSTMQYRSIVLPLQRLRDGVREAAKAQFSRRLDPLALGHSAEFVDLAQDFNNMASELDDFYRSLEEQVRAKSRELVRSERLASVGFLAAGVAHEINNPLNIISGYAEIAGKRLEVESGLIDSQTIAQARDSLRIIREEAFRCKEITSKLLSLSRNGGERRENLDLGAVARDVATMAGGLKIYKDRKITIQLNSAEPLQVKANLTEMKQVLLNLTVNALEASPSPGGEVCIEGRRKNEWVEISVRDNGRGMKPDILRHVFEPFFTVRNGKSPRGTGLGLSITHAIVESHRGRIEAESDGPGRGARFIVLMPIASDAPSQAFL